MLNKYRPDIDGLRAVAVLLVLLHHLFPTKITGGFVGVDIFFVISGFLITTQIFSELEKGTFSVRKFYQRRINRIIPPLFAVSVITLFAGLMILSPADMVLLARSALCAMLGVSNIFFWKEYGSYFSQNSAEAPLLHTWSLGVEEQYYVIWPLILLAAFKLVKRHVVILVVGGVVLAIFASELLTRVAASASYYLLPARFFELLLGGAVALLAACGKMQWVRRFKYSTVFGLVLIVVAALGLNDSSVFPGINAVIPCLGAAILIFVGAERRPAADCILGMLSRKPVVALGLVSYSLYLWHWPIIAWLNYRNIHIDGLMAVFVITLSGALSWITWRFVEIPFRSNGACFSFLHIVGWRYVLPVVCLAYFLWFTTSTQGFPGRFDSAVAEMEQALSAKPEILRNPCHSAPALYFKQPNSDECRLGEEKTIADGFLVGDSYANHFTGMVHVMAQAAGLSVTDYTMDSCPPLVGYKAPVNPERCKERIKIAFDYIKRNRFSKVILAANWPDNDRAGESLDETIRLLLDSGTNVTLVVNNAYIPQASKCPIKKLMYKTDSDCSAEPRQVVKYMQEIKGEYPSVNVIDPNLIICRGGTCIPTYEGLLLYRDNGHLNDLGSRMIGEKLLSAGFKL